MKSYSEIFTHFSSLTIKDKEDYLLTLTLGELRLFRDGLPMNAWKGYIEYVYHKRLLESREEKLNNLGI